MIRLPHPQLLQAQRQRLGNLAILLPANGLVAVIGFVTTVTIANTLGSERFGQLAYALAVGGILAVNIHFGMDRSLIRDLVHYPDRFNEILAASLLARGGLLAATVAGLILLVLLVPFEVVGISTGMFLVILAVMLNPLQIASVFDVWERQGRFALYGVLERVVYFGLIWAVVLAAPERLGLAWIGFALLAGTLLFLALQCRYALGRLRPTIQRIPLRQITRMAWGLLASNRWLWLAALCALGLGAANKVVLRHVSGSAELGVFAASFQVVAIGILFVNNIGKVGKPILARRLTPGTPSAHAGGRFLALYVLVMMGAASLVAIPAMAFPDAILGLLFTAEYAGGAWVLRILALFLYAQTLAAVFNQYLVYSRMDRVFLLAQSVAGLAGALSCALLIPAYSGVGAALSILLGTALGVGLAAAATFHTLRKWPVRPHPIQVLAPRVPA